MNDVIETSDVPTPSLEETKRTTRKAASKPAPKAKASGSAALDKAEEKARKAQEAADKRNAANAEKTRLAAEKAAAKALKAATPKVVAEKPAPVMYEGFEVKADADPELIAKEVSAAKEALSAINSREADTLSSYLVIGEVLSKVAPQFKSVKVYGQFIAANLPDMLKVDSATRSNSKWLYENQTDVLRKLGVNNLTDRSGNPTVLRQMYRKAEAEEAAQAKGKTAEELATEEKAAKKARKEELDAIIKAGTDGAIQWIAAAANKAKAVSYAEQVIRAILADFDREAVADYLVSMNFNKAETPAE